MAPGFSVYLANLGMLATLVDEASDAFAEVARTGAGPGRIAENAFGFIGRQSNFPQKYRSMCDNVVKGANQASRAFEKSADEFLALEKRYAARDDDWAKEFGVKADHIKPHIPDLGKQKLPAEGAPGQPGTPRIVPLPNANPEQPKLPQTI
jgi:hypothetical protein